VFVDPDRNPPSNEVSGVCQMTFHSAALRLETGSQTLVNTIVGRDIASFPRGGLRPSSRDDWPAKATTAKNESRISAKPQRIMIVSIHHRLSLVSVAHRGRAALYRSQLVSWVNCHPCIISHMSTYSGDRRCSHPTEVLWRTNPHFEYAMGFDINYL
jgi:hypothetical protein